MVQEQFAFENIKKECHHHDPLLIKMVILDHMVIDE